MMIEIALERAAGVLASDSLKSALILSVAGFTVAAWRGASASSRHLIWAAAVVATIALPVAGLLLPTWRSTELTIQGPDSRMAASARTATPPTAESSAPLKIPAPASAIATPRAATETPRRRPAVPSVPAREPSDIVASSTSITSSSTIAPSSTIATRSLGATVLDASREVGWAGIALTLWLAGFSLVLLPFCVGRLRLRRVAASARPVTDGRWIEILERMRAAGATTRRATLLESHDAAMPMTWGVISPVLLIPANTEEWPEWKCRNILLHELAHIERLDCLTQMVARLACAVYWFNPLVWVAAHRMRVERELACDDRVINSGSRPSEYASHLLDVALSLRPARATAQAAIAMARPSQLSGRLTAVLDRERNRKKASPMFRAAIGAMTLGVLLPVASFSPFVTEATAASPSRTFPLPAATGNAHASNDSVVVTSSQASSPSDTTPATEPPPAPAAPGYVVSTTSGATSSTLVTTRSGAGFGFTMETTPIGTPGYVAAMLYSAAQNAACWESKRDGSNHISINNDGSGGNRTTVTFSSGDCTLDIRAEGTFTLRPDLTDLATIERGGFFSIEERAGRSSRRMEIRPGSGGLEHVYYVDGSRTEYSTEARSWLAQVLLATERRTAFAASTRVPQIFEGGGAKGVLDEVSLMQSDYAKAAYLGALFKQGVNFDAATLTRVVRQSTREMTSDYYLAEVFNLVGAQRFTDESTWRAFADAAGGIKSDYYKAQVIGKVLSRDRLDAGTIAVLLKAASTIDSDYYQAETLQAMSRKYAVTPETRPYYLAALEKIKSDYYRQQVLTMLGTAGPLDATTTTSVLRSVGDMKSDYYKSETLISLTKRGHFNATTRHDYFAAVRTIDSDYYKHVALNASLAERPLSRETVVEILAVAPSIKSDSELSGLLASLAQLYPIDESLRPAWDKAVDAIGSQYYRGAALDAARRSSTSR